MNEATAVMQVRFSYNQKATVKAVIAGAADVGMVGCQTPKLVQCGRQMAAMLKVWVAVYVTCREISARICLCTSPEKDTGGRISRPGVVRASRGARQWWECSLSWGCRLGGRLGARCLPVHPS